MAVGLSLMIIFGLLVDWLVSLIKLPGLIGLLFLGVVFGPYGLNIMSHETLDVSADWRMIALVVILLRAGFELSRKALQVGLEHSCCLLYLVYAKSQLLLCLLKAARSISS